MKQENVAMISREMTIEEILGSFPQKSQKLAQAITAFGLNCVGCGAAVWETLEAGMFGHGFTSEQVDELVGKLNEILQEKTDASAITITKKAARKLVEIQEQDLKMGWALRFGYRAAGCSGFEYMLDFSEKAESDDEVFHSEGLEIHVEKSMVARLMGSEIDYIEGLNGAGFKISNPNAKSSCGCGKSQSF